jgi:uncharacterized membrane protein YphA (DoxX/SURF4 family)
MAVLPTPCWRMGSARSVWCLINLAVALLLVHHAAFLSNDHAELVLLYIGGVLALLIAGPGRYSADSWIVART